MPILLASQSPRRREILTLAGIPFTVRAGGVEEIRAHGEAGIDYVQRLAREKARAVSADDGQIVLAADTTVVVEDNGEVVLEKPADAIDARRMLSLLGGREHIVYTGICLRKAGFETVDVATTRVRFSYLTRDEIDAYVASGEPMGKAGAYAIQGLAAKFVESIDGCYFNVMGLPISLVYRHLKNLQ